MSSLICVARSIAHRRTTPLHYTTNSCVHKEYYWRLGRGRVACIYELNRKRKYYLFIILMHYTSGRRRHGVRWSMMRG